MQHGVDDDIDPNPKIYNVYFMIFGVKGIRPRLSGDERLCPRIGHFEPSCRGSDCDAVWFLPSASLVKLMMRDGHWGYRSLTTWKVRNLRSSVRVIGLISRETKDSIRRECRIAMCVISVARRLHLATFTHNLSH
eukprot:scaffold6000_cov103-Skeletonema_dohrnii-CCMP3373.AAC.5